MTDPQSDNHSFHDAQVKQRKFLAVWLIPVVAALIAGYLAVKSYLEHGPEVTIVFKSGEGLSPGQTQIRYKAVTLGTIDRVELNEDLSGVIAHAHMTGGAKNLLTENTSFWLVRPALTTSNFSDIQSLVTGTYIQLEPSDGKGEYKTNFVALDRPPDDRSDDPGTVFILKTDSLRGINIGSPVYYRDTTAGQVLGYDIGNGFGPISVSVLIRAPFVGYVRTDSRFWNASGLTVKFAGGVHVELQSLQALLLGGISFYTPGDAQSVAKAKPRTVFTLYENRKMAELDGGAGIQCVSYFQSAVKDLARGSPVVVYGMQVGQVSDVTLKVDPATGMSTIRVGFQIQPDLMFGKPTDGQPDATQILNGLMQKGMRAKLESSEIIVGQQQLTLEFAPGATETQLATEGDALVIQGASDSAGNLTSALSDIVGKLNQIPFADIGSHLDHLLDTTDKTVSGPEMQQAVHSLSITLQNAEKISQDAKENLSPALKRLPGISAQLDSATKHANAFLSSVDNGYGNNSDFQRSVKRVMDEVNDAARSIKLLSDYVDHHPESLIQGRGNGKDK